jgi:hypothetical protein
MDDVELKLLAKRIGVDDRQKIPEAQGPDRGDRAEGRGRCRGRPQAIRDMEARKPRRRRARRQAAAGGAHHPRAQRRILPRHPAGRRAAVSSPEEDHPRFGGDYDVPNGKYRVAGSEWLFLIHKKKLQGVERSRATEANKYGGKHVIAVD